MKFLSLSKFVQIQTKQVISQHFYASISYPSVCDTVSLQKKSGIFKKILVSEFLLLVQKAE